MQRKEAFHLDSICSRALGRRPALERPERPVVEPKRDWR